MTFANLLEILVFPDVLIQLLLSVMVIFPSCTTIVAEFSVGYCH